VAAVGWGFRAAWVVAALAFIGWGLVAGRRLQKPGRELVHATPDEEVEQDSQAEQPRLSFRTLYRQARNNPELLTWLLGATLCSLMDETLVAFCALWMRERFGSDSAAISGVLALTLGGLVGPLLLHRLLSSIRARRLMLGFCLGAMLTLLAWLFSDSQALALLALGALGACAATHHPLAQAAAYRALPGASSTVAALSQLFGPLDLLIPVLLGLLADRYGLRAALLGLLLQPLGLIVALLSGRGRSRNLIRN
jgi:fucose permease